MEQNKTSEKGQPRKLSLNKQTLRYLSDKERKDPLCETSFFGCGLTAPCTYWPSCTCEQKTGGCA